MRGTGDLTQYAFDEENRLACFNKGPLQPTPMCDSVGMVQFLYDHAGVRKRKHASTPTTFVNQYFTDFGGGPGMMRR